jgi:ribonuclease HII
MVRAIKGLRFTPGQVLIDGPLGIPLDAPQKTIVDGDATCCSIAAASIVAKVARDALMCRIDRAFPGYRFASNKGYATRDHLEAIGRLGTCSQHRNSWLAVQRRAAQGVLDLDNDVEALEAADAAG